MPRLWFSVAMCLMFLAAAVGIFIEGGISMNPKLWAVRAKDIGTEWILIVVLVGSAAMFLTFGLMQYFNGG